MTLGSDGLSRPKLRSYLRAEPLDAGHIALLGEESHAILQGGAFVRLLPRLDGSRTVPMLVDDLAGVVSAPELFYALDDLAAQGYLVDGADDGEADPTTAAFWHLDGVGASAALERVGLRTVEVAAVGSPGVRRAADALEEALRESGARVDGAAPALRIVVVDDYLRRQLAADNEASLRARRPWALCRLSGATAWLGPVFLPGDTGCWACLASRLRANRQAERYLAARRGEEPVAPAGGMTGASLALGAALLVTDVVRWLATDAQPVLAGRVVTVDVRTGATRHHVLARRPQCPACGPPPSPAQPVGDALDEARRQPAPARPRDPDEAWARLEHLVSPITGIVSELRSLDAGRRVAHSYIAVHDFPMFRDDVTVLNDNLLGRSGGKGATDVAARVGAVGEAVERYSGVWRPEEDEQVVTSWSQLDGRALSLPEVLGFSAAQIDEREAWNRGLDDPHQVVPRPLDPDLEIGWTPLWSLTDSEERLLPAAFCWYGHPDMRRLFCFADSNGCAAAPTLDDAIYRGFMELAERDAVAIWWYNRLRRPAVDLDRMGLPEVAELRRDYASRGRELWALDLTNDLRVPTFAALSARTDRAVEDLIMGFGADLDPRAALRHALDELNQSELSLAGRTVDGSTIYRGVNAATKRWLTTATLETNPYFRPSPQAVAPAPPDAVRGLTDAERVDACVEIARGAGLSMSVLDQTRPDVGVPVCRVVVPGLCHFWRRLGHSRLYDVPVRLGWLPRPTAETELNPSSIYF